MMIPKKDFRIKDELNLDKNKTKIELDDISVSNIIFNFLDKKNNFIFKKKKNELNSNK